jgi:hypothetical protein
MAGACDFGSMALGSCGVPPFEIGVKGSVGSRYQHPAWFASPRSRESEQYCVCEAVCSGRKVKCKSTTTQRGGESVTLFASPGSHLLEYSIPTPCCGLTCARCGFLRNRQCSLLRSVMRSLHGTHGSPVAGRDGTHDKGQIGMFGAARADGFEP